MTYMDGDRGRITRRGSRSEQPRLAACFKAIAVTVGDFNQNDRQVHLVNAMTVVLSTYRGAYWLDSCTHEISN